LWGPKRRHLCRDLNDSNKERQKLSKYRFQLIGPQKRVDTQRKSKNDFPGEQGDKGGRRRRADEGIYYKTVTVNPNIAIWNVGQICKQRGRWIVEKGKKGAGWGVLFKDSSEGTTP